MHDVRARRLHRRRSAEAAAPAFAATRCSGRLTRCRSWSSRSSLDAVVLSTRGIDPRRLRQLETLCVEHSVELSRASVGLEPVVDTDRAANDWRRRRRELQDPQVPTDRTLILAILKQSLSAGIDHAAAARGLPLASRCSTRGRCSLAGHAEGSWRWSSRTGS